MFASLSANGTLETCLEHLEVVLSANWKKISESSPFLMNIAIVRFRCSLKLPHDALFNDSYLIAVVQPSIRLGWCYEHDGVNFHTSIVIPVSFQSDKESTA